MNLKQLREFNIKLTKHRIKESVTPDFLIIQTIHTIDELNKLINRLAENIRERYSYYSLHVSKMEDLSKLIDAIKKKEIDKELAIENKEDYETILGLLDSLKELIKAKEVHEEYLDKLMNKCCPHMTKISGPLIGARLVALAGSLKRLAELPSSTIQILGAEKALFRHLKTNARPPKFGVIFSHPDIAKAEAKMRGKVARHLASKMAIAVKKDYFR